MKPFIPMPAATANVDVAASSGSVSLAVNPGSPIQVRVMNDGSATAWINFGVSGVSAALATGVPVPAGAVEVLTVQPQGATIFAAAIAAGSTGKIYFTPGVGI